MKIKILCVFFLGVTIIISTSCEYKQSLEQSPESIQMPSIPVLAVPVSIKDLTLYVETIGTIEPSLMTAIRPEINGTIKEIFVKEGQWVQKEAPVFQIDSKPFLLKVKEIEAQLAIDQANLTGIQKKLNRFRGLVQKDLIAQSEWEELESQEEAALAAISLDKAHLNSIKFDLERCLHLASTEGRVGKIDAYEGLLVINGQTEPVVIISKMNPLLVRFDLTEKEVCKIKTDAQFFVEVLSSNTVKTGFFTFLDNHFDSKTGLIMAQGYVENEDFSLRPGQIIKVRVPVNLIKNAKLIPQKAIRYNQQGPFVYILQPDSTVAIRQINLGEEYESEQIVLDGIEESEQVVTDGHLRLFPGLTVEVKTNS